MQMAASGNYLEASAAIQKLHDNKKYKEKDRVLYYLNQGMLQHYLGNYEQSNNLLTTAERAMEDLYTRSVSRAGASLLLNDNVLEYDGEDYELLFTLPADRAKRIKNQMRAKFFFGEIGRIVDKKDGFTIVDKSGQAKPVEMKGFKHF